jgi:hypothetical protein
MEASAPEVRQAPQIGPLPYKLLKATSPLYDLDHWSELRALYLGGKYLLKHPEVFARVFPSHGHENPKVYAERKQRAFYVNHVSTVIDHLVAGLSADPIAIRPKSDDLEADVELPPEWKAFMDDCSPPGGRKQPFTRLMLEQARWGLLFGHVWTLVDLPAMQAAYANLAEQQEAGALKTYACAVAPESVLDWDEAADGRINWAMTCSVSKRRTSPAEGRNVIREEYMLYTAEAWGRYVVEYKADGSNRPGDDQSFAPIVGEHSFEGVPLLRHQLPPGLWAGGKLHSLAVEYLNKSCALSYAEYKSLYSQLYEFLAPEVAGIDSAISTSQEDPNRAMNTKRGPGWVQVRGHQDDARYVGPDTSAYTHAAEAVKALEERMMRITFEMALAEDNSGALVRRSEGSKKQDHAQTEVVLGALGEHLREHAEQIWNTAARGTEAATEFSASGFEEFDSVDTMAIVERQALIEQVPVPSATYQVERKMSLVKADLGENADEELLETIREELEGAITQDTLDAAANPMPQGMPGEGGAPFGDEGGDEEGDEPLAKATIRAGTMGKRGGGRK